MRGAVWFSVDLANNALSWQTNSAGGCFFLKNYLTGSSLMMKQMGFVHKQRSFKHTFNSSICVIFNTGSCTVFTFTQTFFSSMTTNIIQMKNI